MMCKRLCLLLAVATPLAAQSAAESRGPFAGSYATLSTAAGDASGLDPEDVLYKETGFSDLPPGLWTNDFVGPARPVLTKGSILYDPTRACGVPTGTVDIDAMSGGLDVILAWSDGTVRVGADSWGAIVFSVGTTTAGAAGGEGQAIRDEVAAPGGAAADLFTYVLDGPQVPLPSDLVDVTMRSQDSTEMGLPHGATDSDIDAVDLNMVAFRLDDQVFGMLPSGPRRFFFSVSPDTITAGTVPLAWWDGTTPSAATIFRTVWEPSKERWTCPQPAWTYADLGLLSSNDVRALAVDESREFLLFSSDDPTLDPLMFFDYGNDASINPYSYQEGEVTTPVADRAGLQDGDVIDAICTLDPGLLDAGTCTVSWTSLMFAQPRAPQFPTLFGYNLNASGFRDWDGTNAVMKTYMVGWAPPKEGGRAWFYHVPSGAGVQFPRSSPVEHNGGPEEFTVVLPPIPFGGACIPFSWFAQAPPPASWLRMDAAYPLQLALP